MTTFTRKIIKKDLSKESVQDDLIIVLTKSEDDKKKKADKE